MRQAKAERRQAVLLDAFHLAEGTGVTIRQEHRIITKAGSAASSMIFTPFNNSGTVSVQSGTLQLNGGGTDVDASYQGAGTVEASSRGSAGLYRFRISRTL